MTYILEVQRYDVYGKIEYPSYNGYCQHIGYMNKIFNTQEEAGDYYNRFNPHMRKINAFEHWRSNWDPESCLMYIVRKHFYEYLKIPAFENA